MLTGDPQRIAAELTWAAEAVARDASTPPNDLRRVLAFLSKVLLVVDQALGDVLPVLVDIEFLTPNDIDTPRIAEVERDLAMLEARSRYRDAEEICSRLHSLSEQFSAQIEPIVRRSEEIDTRRWQSLFWLLNEHEGAIISMVGSTIRGIRAGLNSATPQGIPEIANKARADAEAIRVVLRRMQTLRSNILGISGRTGLLELTEEHGESGVVLNIHRDQRSYDVDVSDSSGHVAVGDHIHQQSEATSSTQLSAAEVMALLGELRGEIANEALPDDTRRRLDNLVSEVEHEAKAEEPDREHAANQLSGIAKLLEKAGCVVTAASGLGRRLVPLAVWAGKAAAWLGI